jgi:uroporphyrinogen III methyltransferase / synthase
MVMRKGKVYLVGAGPGDPGLITVKGRDCLRRAEVVIYDNLCNPYLLREASSSAEIIYAGKHSGSPSVSQSRIDRLMSQRALAGKLVVRLKGGDPFVFGRGGEEALALRQKGISFEVIPGITSATAVPAYAGIPVTHRDYSSGFAVVTAYENAGKREPLNYHALARFPGTLIFLMGVKRLPEMIQNLIASGKSPQTPVALIRWGTRGLQETLTGNLRNIAERAQRAEFRPPATVVVGDVVKCRAHLQWFERRPLIGKRVVITRSRDQEGAFASKLINLGAEVIELPTIQIRPLKTGAVRNAVNRACQWDWIVFTSAWAVEFYLDAVLATHGDIRILKNAKFAAIGQSTAAKLKERGLKVELVPSIQSNEGLIDAILKRKKLEWEGKQVLLPRSEIAKSDIAQVFKKVGADVHSIAIYENILPKIKWEALALERIGADYVVFTSSSTAENFFKLIKPQNGFSKKTCRLLLSCRFISIGPSTSATIRKLGFKVFAEAKQHNLDGLIKRLADR